MSMLKQSLVRLFDGFLLGLGFSIPFTAVYLGVTYYTTDIMFEKYQVDVSEPNYGLVLGESRVEVQDKKYVVLGTVTNPISADVTGVNIEAEFFGEDGTFIEKCSGTLSGELKSSATRNYRIRCGTSSFSYGSHSVSIVQVSKF